MEQLRQLNTLCTAMTSHLWGPPPLPEGLVTFPLDPALQHLKFSHLQMLWRGGGTPPPDLSSGEHKWTMMCIM